MESTAGIMKYLPSESPDSIPASLRHSREQTASQQNAPTVTKDLQAQPAGPGPLRTIDGILLQNSIQFVPHDRSSSVGSKWVPALGVSRLTGHESDTNRLTQVAFEWPSTTDDAEDTLYERNPRASVQRSAISLRSSMRRLGAGGTREHHTQATSGIRHAAFQDPVAVDLARHSLPVDSTILIRVPSPPSVSTERSAHTWGRSAEGTRCPSFLRPHLYRSQDSPLGSFSAKSNPSVMFVGLMTSAAALQGTVTATCSSRALMPPCQASSPQEQWPAYRETTKSYHSSTTATLAVSNTADGTDTDRMRQLLGSVRGGSTAGRGSVGHPGEGTGTCAAPSGGEPATGPAGLTIPEGAATASEVLAAAASVPASTARPSSRSLNGAFSPHRRRSEDGPEAAVAAAAAFTAFRKASTFHPLSFQAPHHRSYQLAVVAGACVYAAAFAPAALLPVIDDELVLSRSQEVGAAVAAMAASFGSFFLLSIMTCRYGPRYCQVMTLLFAAPVLACTALVTNSTGFVVTRFLLGATLGLRVVTQYWLVAMFDFAALGAAAAMSAGVSLAGGGVSMMLSPLVYEAARSIYDDDLAPSWRAAFYFLAAVCLAVAVLTLAYGQDTPSGDFMDPKPARAPRWEQSQFLRRFLPQTASQRRQDLRLAPHQENHIGAAPGAAAAVLGRAAGEHKLQAATAAAGKQQQQRPYQLSPLLSGRQSSGYREAPVAGGSGGGGGVGIGWEDQNGVELRRAGSICAGREDGQVAGPAGVLDGAAQRAQSLSLALPQLGEAATAAAVHTSQLWQLSGVDGSPSAVCEAVERGASGTAAAAAALPPPPPAMANSPARGAAVTQRKAAATLAQRDVGATSPYSHDYDRACAAEFGRCSGGCAASSVLDGSHSPRSSHGGWLPHVWTHLQMYRYVARLPFCWLLAFNYGLTHGSQLAVLNILPMYLHQEFHKGLFLAGAITCAFGLTAAFSRLWGSRLSGVASRRLGMRGRLWLLWAAQAASGVFCALLGLAHGSLAGTVVLLMLFGCVAQLASGVTFTISPFVSYRCHTAVTAMVAIGGQAGAAIMLGAFFLPSGLSYAHGLQFMGIASVVASVSLLLLRFPMWGSMLKGPSPQAAGDEWLEERYYAREWTPYEREQGIAAVAAWFALLSKAERSPRFRPGAVTPAVAEAEANGGGAETGGHDSCR